MTTFPGTSFLKRIKSLFVRPVRGEIDERMLSDLESVMGYTFEDRSRLIQSLSHRSYLKNAQRETSNERLEFLGDAVLSLVVNEHLFTTYPDKREGALTKMKSVIVSKQILSHYAKRNQLGRFVLLSENAQRAKVAETASVLADTLEAIFGAIFLDGGFGAARTVIRSFLLTEINAIFTNEDNINYKSLLQEYIQALHKVPPRYRVRGTSGPEHEKEFAVDVCVREHVLGEGMGKTKKLAEQVDARVGPVTRNHADRGRLLPELVRRHAGRDRNAASI